MKYGVRNMLKNTRLVLDSNEFIFDFLKTKKECVFLIRFCRKNKINIIIPTLVLEEVFRNIKVETNKDFSKICFTNFDKISKFLGNFTISLQRRETRS